MDDPKFSDNSNSGSEIETISSAVNAPVTSIPTLQSSRPNQEDYDNLLVNPPFPPNIDPKVLALELLVNRKKSKKMLNEFFIYRKQFVQELKRRNLRPRQTKVSTLASTSWHRQPPSVKDEYRRLARETEKHFMSERQRVARETISTSPENSTSIASSLTLPVSDQGNLQLPPFSFLRMPDAIDLQMSQTNYRRTSFPISNFGGNSADFSYLDNNLFFDNCGFDFDQNYMRNNVTYNDLLSDYNFVNRGYPRPTFTYTDQQVFVPSVHSQDDVPSVHSQDDMPSVHSQDDEEDDYLRQ